MENFTFYTSLELLLGGLLDCFFCFVFFLSRGIFFFLFLNLDFIFWLVVFSCSVKDGGREV